MANAFHTLTVAETLTKLESSLDGLSDAEAAARLARDGRNELPPPKRTSWLVILARQFAGPLIAVLIAAAVVSVVLREYGDAGFIAVVLVFNALLGFFQEVKAEREIIRLFTLMRTTVRVERDDELREIDAAELVCGDIVWLESGARVPADIRVVQERDVNVDESALTGESLSVSKTTAPGSDPKAIPAEQHNMLFAGTSITRGRAVGVVTATATNTELGEVARELESTLRGKPPLVTRIEKLSKQVAIGTVGGCLLVFGVGVARGFPVAETFLMGVALAVAAIPEGLPVAITLALAVGLKRMASRKVLVRRLEAVEGLGSCTVICTDKTGTLTMNELTVNRIATPRGLHEVTGAGYSLSGEFRVLEGKQEDPGLDSVLESACFANEATLARDEQTGKAQVSGDPTDIALLVAGRKRGLKREKLIEHHPEVATLPFESERQFAASFNQQEDTVVAHLKGAPERILAMCTDAGDAPLDVENVRRQIAELSAGGLRVLAIARGVASSDVAHSSVPVVPEKLSYLGLIAMRDAPRLEAQTAIRACHDASIRVIVATGDHALTAVAVAIELGVVEEGANSITGQDIEAMSDEEFHQVVRDTNVFARVTPSHKLRLVNALKEQGELVAMTGDGANDAGALKAANIGVAMGLRGTDVAKEAARVVITDDNFASIVAGIEEGRIVHENVRNVVALLVMTGLGEVFAILFAIVIGLPMPLTAVQLLWANLATEGLQVVGLALEPGSPGILKRPPRPPDERIFNRMMIVRTILVSVVIGVSITSTHWYLLEVANFNVFAASNMVLLLLVLIENIHIGNCRNERRSGFANSPLRNPWLLGAAVTAQGVHLLAMNWGPTQRLLGIEPVSVGSWLAMFAISLSVLVVVELHKLWLWWRERDTGSREQTTPLHAVN
ncbi:MAG: HAD-IC family P-type ATPase [Planctomycetes bacterium]|nr:HAD-IC family P-type ATPase [Planctomycetota bacterium]